MTRVIIVRHGQSTYNIVRRIQGRTDASELTEKGCNDAAKVGEALSNIYFDAVYHSPLTRATQTAEIIKSQLVAANKEPNKICSYEKLIEVHLPLWEGMLNSEVREIFAEEYRIWKEYPHELSMRIQKTGKEEEYFPVLALYEQAKQFWQDILPLYRGDRNLMIVAHNGINRALISTAVGISPERYHSIQQSNCGFSVLNFTGDLEDSVELESLNQTQHLGEVCPSLRPNHQGVRLFLVRHGETQWNNLNKFQGQIDVPLNDLGKSQANKTATFLQTENIDFACSSSMERARETAEIILQHHQNVELELLQDLKEINHGLWQGKTEVEIDREYPGELQRWRKVPAEVQMPQGENLQQLWQRSHSCWLSVVETALEKQYANGIVFAHGDINQALICHILGLLPEKFWSIKNDNAALSVIDYPRGLNGLPVLQAMNINAHLVEEN